MTPSRLAPALLALLLLAQPVAALAAEPAEIAPPTGATTLPTASTCLTQVFAALARQQRLHRVVLFGRSKAEDAGQSEIRYDTDGAAWIKHLGSWKTLSPGKENQTLSDAEMDERLETDPNWESPIRRGIVETKTHVTSELIPDMLQSMRALRCRLRSVCSAAAKSETATEGQTQLTGSIDGCLPFTDLGISVLTACRFNAKASTQNPAEVRQSCNQAAQTLYDREMRVLELVVEYDAAYRTLLQFAGTVELFIREFDAGLLTPFRQTAALLAQLSRIPCFLSQCEL